MLLMVLAIVGITLYGNPLVFPVRNVLAVILAFQIAAAAPKFAWSVIRQRSTM